MMDNVVVVTGANRGLGLAITQDLLRKNYSVFALCRVKSAALEAICEQHHGRIETFYVDLLDEESVKVVAREVISKAKSISGLVNCAGIASGSLFAMTKLDDIKANFQVNFFSAILLSQYIARKMMRQQIGSIVNIASTAGLLGDKGTLSYGGSKAALIHATRVMASELGAANIRVNAIAPAIVETEMARAMDEKSIDVLNNRAALQSKIQPNEICELVEMLLSDRMPNLTGQVIRVDKGMPF